MIIYVFFVYLLDKKYLSLIIVGLAFFQTVENQGFKLLYK